MLNVMHELIEINGRVMSYKVDNNAKYHAQAGDHPQ